MPREGFGIRFAAALVDLVIMIVVMFVITLIFGGSLLAMFGSASRNGTTDRTAATAAAGTAVIALILLALIPLAYSLMEVFNAATLGKMALGLKIANEDGSPANMQTLLTRWSVKNSGSLLKFLGVLTTISFIVTLGNLAGLVIFIGCFFTLGEKRQAFHDMAAHTAVFRKTAGIQQGFQVMPPTPPPQV